MKNRLFTRFMALLLCIAIAVSALPIFTATAATGTVSYNSTTRHVVSTSLSAKATAYYTGNNTYEKLSQLSGVSAPNDSWAATQNNNLYDALQTLMSSTHTVSARYNPSGEQRDELSYLWDFTDAAEGSHQYLYFYTDILADDYGTSDMQREHVWPQSNASYFQLNGGADLHHLRPSIGSVNSAKSNHTFANVREKYSSYDTCSIDSKAVIWVKSSNGAIEVRDNVKGDIARILLYVYCRWGQPNLYSDVSSSKLPALDSDDSMNKGIRAIDNLDTLLEWMEMDPVDTWEMTRNDQVENFQGNRNVFIDYPEFAWLMFNKMPPSSMQTPSGEASGAEIPAYTITAVSSNTDYGTVSLSGSRITATPKSGYEVTGYTVLSGNATVSQNGNIFTVSPSSDCTIRINFAKITYKVTVAVNSSSYGSATVEGYTITAVPKAGYQVSGYTLISGSATVARSGNIFTVTPATDCTIRINFSVANYTLTATSNNTAYGTVRVEGYTITASPKEGYEVSGYTLVSGTASVVQSGNIFTVTPTSNCTIRINFSTITYEVEATVNSSLYGSVMVEDYTIIAVANEGYRIAGYTVVEGDAMVEQDGSYFYVTPSSNCTIRINFEMQEGYTIDFYVPEGVTQAPISGYEGDIITLPTPLGTPTANAREYTFVGWTPSAVDSTTAKPTIYKAGSSYCIVESTTLYALYTYIVKGTGESHYTLVTDTDELSIGANVVIASTNYSYAMSTVQNSTSRGMAAITKNSSNNTISFTGAVCIFELKEGSQANTWAFYDSTNNGYIYAASSRSNALQTQSTINDNASFRLNFASGNVTMTASGTNTINVLGFNSLIYGYFTCYSSTSSSRGNVQLYMMSSDDTIYYTTVLESLCTHNYSVTESTDPTCTAAGNATYTCTLCGNSYTETLDALGHNYRYTSTVAPTPSAQGYDIYTCTNCGLTQQQNYTQPTGYNYTVTFSVPRGVDPIAPKISNTLSGITLPNTTGTPDDISHATFLGWVTNSIVHSETVDSYLTAGSNYIAQKDITLYALYQYYVDESTTEFFSIGKDGDYVIAANVGGTYYAVNNALSLISGKIYGQVIEVADGRVTDANAGDYVLTFDYIGASNYTISNGNYYFAYGTGNNFASNVTTPYIWAIETGTNGSWRIYETTNSDPYAVIFYNYSTTPRFGAYVASNVTSRPAQYFDLEILPVANGLRTSYYTTTFEKECSHEQTTTNTVAATCTQSGSIIITCNACSEVLSETKIPATGHSYIYANNGTGHTVGCSNCTYSVTEAHTYVSGKCVCGAVEAPTMNYIPTMTVNMSIGVGTEMVVTYSIPASRVKAYESFYLEVVKTVANGESVKTIFSLDEGNLAVSYNATTGAISRYSGRYTGIAAKEMGDSFSATLYAVDADGKLYYGPANTSSIKEYLLIQIESASASAELKTLAVDMLHYGAAAQIHFAYDTENLVNSDLTEEQLALGTQEEPVAINNFAQSSTGCRVNTSVSIGSKVELYLTFIYKPTANSNMQLRIKNASGEVIETLAPDYTVGANYKAIYDNVGAKQMRELITIELYDNDTLVSMSTTWSVETYVAQTIENSASSAELVKVCKTMLTYGDSAAAYLEATDQ